MRDIPVFTTEYGAAGLVLREIPYKGIAYIIIHDTLQPKELLKECVGFCRSAGAEEIYATGHSFLEHYPLYTAIFKMERLRDGLQQTDAVLQAVTEETLEQWRALYNEKMKAVSNGATMTRADSEKHIKQGTAYFVYRSGTLLGIGVAAGERVESVIAAKPGCGEDVLLALCTALHSERVILEVASANLPALRLYERLGFQKTVELSLWYDVRKLC